MLTACTGDTSRTTATPPCSATGPVAERLSTGPTCSSDTARDSKSMHPRPCPVPVRMLMRMRPAARTLPSTAMTRRAEAPSPAATRTCLAAPSPRLRLRRSPLLALSRPSPTLSPRLALRLLCPHPLQGIHNFGFVATLFSQAIFLSRSLSEFCLGGCHGSIASSSVPFLSLSLSHTSSDRCLMAFHQVD